MQAATPALPERTAHVQNVQFGDKQMEIQFCNRDAANRVSVTISTDGFRGTQVEGWYRVEPGRCRSVYVWTSDEKKHHFLFRANDALLEMTPRVYELFGLKGTGGLSPSGESFCVNLNDVTDIESNLLSPGRATNCRGTEKLVPFSIKMIGGYDQAQVNIPAFSGSGPATSPGGDTTLKTILDWFN